MMAVGVLVNKCGGVKCDYFALLGITMKNWLWSDNNIYVWLYHSLISNPGFHLPLILPLLVSQQGFWKDFGSLLS